MVADMPYGLLYIMLHVQMEASAVWAKIPCMQELLRTSRSRRDTNGVCYRRFLAILNIVYLWFSHKSC